MVYVYIYSRNNNYNREVSMAKKRLVVTASSISDRADGLGGYFNYLNNINHKNHKGKTTEIAGIYGDESKMRNIMGNSFDYEMQHLGKRGHRKLESFAMSFDLTTPKGSGDMSLSTWKRVFKDVAVDCMNHLKLEPEQRKEFQKVLYCNLHRQKAGNDHANFVIGKFFCGERHRALEQKTFLNMLKTSYNRAVLKHDPNLFMSCAEFKETESGLRKGRVSQWKHDLTQANKAKDELNTYKARLKSFHEEFGEVDERLDSLVKKLKNIPVYLKRYYKALEESDLKKINKTKRLYDKLVDGVDSEVDNIISNNIDERVSDLKDKKVDRKVDYTVGLEEFMKVVGSEIDTISKDHDKIPPKRPKSTNKRPK